jgi:hypothetical protein
MTPEKIFPTGSAADGRKNRLRFVFDPATGALIVSPDLDLKIRKAIMGEARRLTYRLYFLQARLYPELLWLKCRRMTLQARRYFFGYFQNLRPDRHQNTPPF